MWRDPIVEEIRQLRLQYAARFGHDLKAICQDLRERQKKSGRKVVTLPPRPARPLKTDGQPAN
jgi:hypothetical protein